MKIEPHHVDNFPTTIIGSGSKKEWGHTNTNNNTTLLSDLGGPNWPPEIVRIMHPTLKIGHPATRHTSLRPHRRWWCRPTFRSRALHPPHSLGYFNLYKIHDTRWRWVIFQAACPAFLSNVKTIFCTSPALMWYFAEMLQFQSDSHQNSRNGIRHIREPALQSLASLHSAPIPAPRQMKSYGNSASRRRGRPATVEFDLRGYHLSHPITQLCSRVKK